MRIGLPTAILASLLVIVPACWAYSPPIRTGDPGAPGRITQGTTEVASTASSVLFPAGIGYTGPAVAYGITDAVAIEAGAEVDFETRGMGWLGVRYTPVRPDRRKIAFVLDLEAGGGAGAAQIRCTRDSCSSNPAGGAYAGFGIGGKFHFFSLYLRGRQQVSDGVGAPFTSYTTGVAGIQFSIVETVHLWAGTGIAGVATTTGNELFGWYPWTAGVSVAFGGWKQREAIVLNRQRRENRRRGKAVE